MFRLTMLSTNGGRMLLTLSIGILASAGYSPVVPAQADGSAPAWILTDISGTTHQLFAEPATKAAVFVSISVDCPIANGYQPLLNRLQADYPAPQFRWILLHPDSGLQPSRAGQHAQEFGIKAPVVIDQAHQLTRRIGFTVTPEAAVFLQGESQPVYRGRIDNLHAGYGKKRKEATSHELADTLAAIAEGKPVRPLQTEAVGCFIGFQDPQQPAAAATSPETEVARNSDRYDPLETGSSRIEELLLEVNDRDRERKIPLRVYLPKVDAGTGDAGAGDADGKDSEKSGSSSASSAPQPTSATEKGTSASTTGPAPVILFSHGLGGNRDGSSFLGRHWAARGYIAVFLQHPGSDESVWKDVPARRRFSAMQQAANGENFLLRVKDVPAVLDQLEIWNGDAEHPLHGRLDMKRVGQSGHSFGAVTTQAVSGQTMLGRAAYTDPRIRAALVLSPSTPRAGSAEQAFGSVDLPWMLMTGTKDIAAIGGADLESRLAVYPALPAGNKFELVLDEAQHSAFTDRPLPGESGERNPNHHRSILALSTAFWDTFLLEKPEARRWLEDDAKVREVLEPDDRWQRK